MGGVVFGELSECIPTLFRWEWPKDVQKQVISPDNLTGTITNLDLEMAGLLLLWPTIKGVCGSLQKKSIPLFGDNSPLIGWVARLGSKQSSVAENLIQALALHLKVQRACPLTPIHIEGNCNAISDVPSWSFGSNPSWTCSTHTELITLFTSLFSLPHKKSWTVFNLNCAMVTRVISILQTKPFKLADWRQLPKIGRHVGKIGAPTFNLWGWIRTLTSHRSKPGYNASRALLNEYDPDSLDADNRCKVLQSLRLSRPFARRSPWPETLIPQR